MMLELAHPELLLLMVLLGLLWILLPLWRPRVARRRTVASTMLWHRAIEKPRSERPWMPLLLALALIVIASGPRVIPDDNPSIALRRVIDGSIRIDIRVANASEGHLETSEQEPRKFLLSDRGEAVIEMDDLAPGIPITVSVGTVNRKLIAPARNSTPIVSDLSDLREVADALAVLKKAHRIELSDSHPDVVIARQPYADSSSPSILFPSSEGDRILPRITVPSSQPALLDGLHPRYWTVLRTAEAPGDPILIDEEGRSLLSRNDDGFLWGFLPGSGDLARRSDWPVLLGRLIEELTPSAADGPPATMLELAGLHLSLMLALLVAILAPFLLGPHGRMPSFCILLAILVGQIPSTAKATAEKIDLEKFSAGESPGTVIECLSSVAPPSPALQRRIRSRGIEIQLKKGTDPHWKVVPPRVRSGQRVNIAGGESVDSLRSISPTGERHEVPPAWNPTVPGAWLIEGKQDGVATLIVEEPIPAALWSEKGSAAENLLPPPAFSHDLSVGQFPRPAAGSVIVWNSVAIDENTANTLNNWIRRGGTFVALPADPFCEDEGTRQRLATILPTEIPPPPQPPVQDLGILLLDLSGSLTGEGASTLLAGTFSILEGSPSQSRWGIAGFRDEPHWIIAPGTRLDRTLLEKIGEQITTGGGTDLGAALRFCREALNKGDGGKSLVVITDGRTTPDDWEAIGTSLKKMQIDFHILLVGETIETDSVEILRRTAEGSLHRARNPQQARALLQEVVQPPEQGWQPVRSPVLIASLDEFLDAGPTRPPVPLRRISVEPGSLTADSKYLWVDGQGAPLLAIRSVGDGTSVVWYSGLDEFSLSSSAPEVIAHLSQLVASCADRRKESRRRGFLVQSHDGFHQLALERRDEDPLSVEITMGRIGQEAVILHAQAVPGTGWLVASIPQPAEIAGCWWRQGRSIDAGVVPARGTPRRWQAILGPGQADAMKLRSPSMLVLMVAILLLLSSRGSRWSDLVPGRETEPAAARHY